MTPVLEARKVSKTYLLGETVISALHNISISINKGEFVAITGKSGSGKSTLMHIIGLLDSPTDGDIILNGQNIKGLSKKELARIRNEEIGFVFQAFNLLQRTSSLDNVILPLKYSKVPKSEWHKRAKDMLNKVELGDRLNNKSNELSGGQKQRVAIARALVTNPSIILADEPTGNLDSKTGEEVQKLLKELHKEGKTIILVTHDDELSNIAERKIVLKDGEVV